MFVSSLSHIVADGLPWRPRFGGHAFVVIAKATFVLRQGQATLAPEQDPILAGDHHYDDDPAQSLHTPSDRGTHRRGGRPGRSTADRRSRS